MRSHRRRFLDAMALGACVWMLGCSSTTEQPETVEVMHWWTSGGEGAALGALLGLFNAEHPNATVIDSGITGSTNARARIQERMIGGTPPETFQANGGWDLLAWVLYNGRNDADSKLEPIDDLAADENWPGVIPRAVLDTVSFNGHTYAVPLNIHRVNTLYYNKVLFAQAGIERPPESLDELFATAAALQAEGITPLALGTKDPWTLPLLLFENLLVARAGGAYYEQFFLGRGSAFAPEIVAALADLQRLLAYVNLNASSLSWSDAVDMLGDGQAAMTIMGDWAKGELLATQPNLDDFGELPMPGTAGTFVFTTDTFGLPRGARNRAGARELLRLFGSKRGQDQFNPLKGSISARGDADTRRYDALAQRTIEAFQTAQSLVPATAIRTQPAFMDQMNGALANFAGAGDAELAGNASVVLHTLDNWYDVLRSSPWK